MPPENIQAIIGTAVTNSKFRDGLLTGSRLRLISNFNLTPEEVNFLMGIKATTIEEFAKQTDKWLTEQQKIAEPPKIVESIRRRRKPGSQS